MAAQVDLLLSHTPPLRVVEGEPWPVVCVSAPRRPPSLGTRGYPWQRQAWRRERNKLRQRLNRLTVGTDAARIPGPLLFAIARFRLRFPGDIVHMETSQDGEAMLVMWEAR